MQTYFNSRPYVRGDFWIFQALCTLIVFQFTPLREGRLSLVFSASSYGVFQFTPLREGRLGNTQRQNQPSYFNSRPYVRGDPFFCMTSVPQQDFNSRPYVRGDLPDQQADWWTGISIHAPT